MKPIAFSLEMARMIMAGKKLQTRRVLIPQPTSQGVVHHKHEGYAIGTAVIDGKCVHYRWPLDRPGDALWMREPWAAPAEFDSVRPVEIPENTPIWYRADGEEHNPARGKWRPGRFMPRKFSTQNLIISNIRIERVQDITPSEVIAEGVPSGKIEDFAALWDRLNAKRGYGWDDNPWVITRSFELELPF